MEARQLAGRYFEHAHITPGQLDMPTQYKLLVLLEDRHFSSLVPSNNLQERA